MRSIFLCIVLLLVFYRTALTEQLEEYIVNADSVIFLLTTYCTENQTNSNSEIIYNLNFSKGHPMLFFEIFHDEKMVIISFVNTRLGGFAKEESVKIVKKGPLKSVSFVEELRDKNEGTQMLKPELYYVTTMTIVCDPVIQNEKDVEIVEKGDAISLIFPWPSDLKQRALLYSAPKSKRSVKVGVIIAGISAAGLAGGGVLLWNYLHNDQNETGDLQPVLPSHY